MEKYIIKQILIEQRDEIKALLKGNVIAREIASKSRSWVESDLIKVIMGVRRSGKSTLAHQLLAGKKYGYINFDDERFINVTSGDLNDFLQVTKELEPDCNLLLLDEIQNVEGWELFANRIKREGYNVIITGSNAKLLSSELATHLTGRHIPIELFPFSFKEYLVYEKCSIEKELDLYSTNDRAQITNALEKYVKAGGFPESYKFEAKGEYLRNLFDKIITRDIVQRYNIKYVKALKEIALYCISNFSSRMTYHKVRNMFDIKSVHTVKNYLNYLEECYLILTLPPFSYKMKEQIRLARKLYCIDTGIIDAIVPKTAIDQGRLIENLVFLELKRRNEDIYFYYEPNFEIDFLIKRGMEIEQLIQVCFSLSGPDTKKREMNALSKASEKLKCKNATILTWDEAGEEKIGALTVKIMPLWQWLSGEGSPLGSPV